MRPTAWPSMPLAYIEWMTPLKTAGQRVHNMYGVSRIISPPTALQAVEHMNRPGIIVPLSSIRRSCMLFPVWGAPGDDAWTSDNVLDTGTSFFVNNWASTYAYQTIW